MDSFLDEPRSSPKPTPIIEELHAPIVPEVSLMFQNSKKNKTCAPINFGKSMQSYNAWKLRSNTNSQEYDSFLLTTTTNKENNINLSPSAEKSFLSKKQVRFENPVQTNLQPHFPVTRQMSANLNTTSPLSETSIKHTENHINNFKLKYTADHCSPITSKTKEIISGMKSVEPTNIINKPFEKLYISNLPHRELDLSFLEPQKNPCGSIKTQSFVPSISESSSSKSYDSFKKYSSKFNNVNTNFSETPRIIQSKIPEIKITPDSLSNSENKKQDEVINNEQNDNKFVCDENKICDNEKTDEQRKQSSNDSVTVSDLLTIIKMQNEQLQLLQSQVEKLVKLNEKFEEEKPLKPVEIPEDKNPIISCKDQQLNKTTENLFESHQQTIENEGKKISVGMMTSFEVCFKPPKPKKKLKNRHVQPVEDESLSSSECDQEIYNKPVKRQENKRNKIHYQQEKQIPRQWKYNFNERNETEYSLGSQETLDIQEPPESPENSIHIDMQEYDTDSSDDECTSDSGWTFYKDILGQVNNLLENSRPSHKPKKEFVNYDEKYTDTTLEEIKRATVKKLQSSNNQLQMKPTEVSFALKQILMKYLPDDELPNAIKKQDEHFKRMKNDISVTAFQYMQQCNLVTNGQHYGRKGKNVKRTPARADPKILDITTLKRQPKFL